jgi:FAD/FMN-containing dehydrogenase
VVPQCRVEPQDAAAVAKVLTVAKIHQCQFAVLAGGTSPFRYASNAEGGITIDMQRMKSVQIVDDHLLHVKVGAGALWADVYRELDPRNMSATGTRNSLTGVTGSILGGMFPFQDEYLLLTQTTRWNLFLLTAFRVVL